LLWAVSGPHACRGSPPPSSRSYTVTVKLSLAAVAVCAAITCLAAGAATLPGSDEFNSTELTGWNVLRGDDVGDGTEHSIAVQGGALVLQPRVSWWVHGTEALYIWKPVTGDFVATMRVNVTGTQAAKPDSDWTLSGILVRNPASTHENENWVSLRTGVVGGSWVYERKTTARSRSVLVLSRSHDGSVDLRIARLGQRFFLLRRNAADRWAVLWTYVRADLPRSLQVGMDAFTGFEAPHGDLISHVDWFRFAPLAPPAKLRNATPAKLLPYLSRA
jgi:hypothetical protein